MNAIKAINGNRVVHDICVFIVLKCPKICLCYLSENPGYGRPME